MKRSLCFPQDNSSLTQDIWIVVAIISRVSCRKQLKTAEFLIHFRDYLIMYSRVISVIVKEIESHVRINSS